MWDAHCFLFILHNNFPLLRKDELIQHLRAEAAAQRLELEHLRAALSYSNTQEDTAHKGEMYKFSWIFPLASLSNNCKEDYGAAGNQSQHRQWTTAKNEKEQKSDKKTSDQKY